MTTLPEVVRAHARNWPQATAVVCGDVRLGWVELDQRVDRLAAGLAAAGVLPGDRVLWLGQNCHRVIELLLAAGRLGAIFCPVNWRQSADELAFVLDDAEPAVVVWQESEIGGRVVAARRASTAAADARWFRHDATADGESSYEAMLATADKVAPGPDPLDPEAPVLMLYTAGFSGRANGALLPHRALMAQSMVEMLAASTGPGDVYLNCGPLFHVGTLKTTLATLLAGGSNVFTPRVEPEELCRLVDVERCTGAFLQPPTQAAMTELNHDGRYDLTSLKARSGWRSGYGQTELAGVVLFTDPARPCLGSAGRPSPLAQVEIVDADGGIAAAGVTGEIVVRGPMVMTGYHRRPELSAERSRGGWHHTGDLGRREEDGSLTFVGPMARLIKSAAENIYPAEVEACLRSHPAVADVAVMGVPDPVWGQSVQAVVVAADGRSVDPDDLIAHCRDRIAGYKKPRSIVFADELPRRNGAVDYQALDDRYGGGGYPGASTTGTPRTPGG